MPYKIAPDGTEERLVPENGEKFTLEEMQAHIGGYVELVANLEERDGAYYRGGRGHAMHTPIDRVCAMWVDEEGLLKGLPFNKTASELCYTAGLRDPSYDIVGPAVIFMLDDLDDGWRNGHD